MRTARARVERRLPGGAATVFLLLALATLALYWPGLSGAFLFDDYPNLVSSNDWRMTSLNHAQLARAFGQGLTGGLGRGLAMVSFGLNHLATGADPWALKLTNVLMHLVAGALTFVLSRQVFRVLAPDAPVDSRAALVAGAWMLHPLQVSTVLYVVQRMEIGAAIGSLAALTLYVHARARQMRGGRSWPWMTGSAACVVVGMGFKESAALAPVFAALLEMFVLRFIGLHGRRSRVLVLAYALGAGIAVVSYVGWILPRYLDADAYAGRAFDVTERLLTQPRMLAVYLGQILLPLPEHLRFYYDDVAASTGWLSPPSTLASALLMLGLLSVAIIERRSRPLLALGIAWFLAAHLLTSNVIPLELAFEHRNYIALLGIAWSVTSLAAEWACSLSRAARTALCGVVLLALGTGCLAETVAWGNPARLAFTLEGRAPTSPRATYALGSVLYDMSGGDPSSPAWSMAKKEFVYSAKLPDSPILAEQALILMQARAGRPADATHWASLRHKLTQRVTRPENVQALYALVACGDDAKCAIDHSELRRTLQSVIDHSPDDADLRMIYANYLLNADHATGKAVEQARAAVRLRPDDPVYAAELAKMLLASDLHESEETESLIARVRQANPYGELDAELDEIARLQRATPAPGLEQRTK